MTPHGLYGLSLRSSCPIPGLRADEVCSGPEVEVTWGHLPRTDEDFAERVLVFPVTDEDRAERPALEAWRLASGSYWLRYDDGTEFVIGHEGRRIWTSWPEAMTIDDAAINLLGPAFGFLLRLHGVLCLHASAIVADGRAVAIAGPAGAGKSTLAAAFAAGGNPILSDDVVPLIPCGGEWLAQPGYPRLRLWPESVELLFGAADALPLLTPNWEKRYLDLAGGSYEFQSSPLPLAAIYFLDDRTEDTSAPSVEPLRPREAFVSLVATTYTNYLLDAPMRAQEFSQIAALVERVPVRRARPHADPKRLRDLREAILLDYASLQPEPAQGKTTG